MAYQQTYAHPYNYAQYTQPVYSPDFQQTQVPFPGIQQGPAGHTPIPRPKKISRNTNTTGHNDPQGLKSAMKRSRGDHGVPASRHTSHSRRDEEKRRGREQQDGLRPANSITSRREERSISRQRTNSRVMFIPDHIFVSFRRDNELCVTNLVEEPALGKLAEAVLLMWPDGHDEMETRHHKWHVLFHGSPWTAPSTGNEGIAARRIIRNVFAQLALLGFSYTTITDTNRFSTPSLIFSRVPPELYNTQSADFFILSISKSQKRLAFIEAPETIVRNLAVDMKQYFPYQVASDRMVDRGLLVLEIRNRVHGTPPLDRHLFIGWVLQYIHRKGYVLEASVPLARKSFSFGLSSKREVWVFRRRGQLGI